jgi:hypothetical protein
MYYCNIYLNVNKISFQIILLLSLKFDINKKTVQFELARKDLNR